MERYRKRVTQEGRNERERLIKRNKALITRKAKVSPAYHKVNCNNEEIELLLKKTQHEDKKHFALLPGYHVNRGDIINWQKSFWMITSLDFGNDLYENGEIRRCNYLLKWQDAQRNIIEKHCIIEFPYISHMYENKVIAINETKCNITLPYDQDSIKITMGHRFFITNDRSTPSVYRVDHVNDIENVFDSHGTISLIMRQTPLNAIEDNIELGICNYKTKQEETNPSSRQASITAIPHHIAIGFTGTALKAHFIVDGQEMSDITPKWTIHCDFIDQLNISYSNGQRIMTIATDRVSLLGRTLTVDLTDINQTFIKDSITLIIKGL